jgi:hypothetical protein
MKHSINGFLVLYSVLTCTLDQSFSQVSILDRQSILESLDPLVCQPRGTWATSTDYVNYGVAYANDRQSEGAIISSRVAPYKTVTAWMDFKSGTNLIGTGYWNDALHMFIDKGTLLNMDGYTHMSDPCVVADNVDSNTFYLSYINHRTTAQQTEEGGVYVRKTTDGGLTWPSYWRLDLNGDAFDDKPWLIQNASNGHLYAVWATALTGHCMDSIKFRKSTDRGVSWGSVVHVASKPAGSSTSIGSPFIAVGPQGYIYVISRAWPSCPDGLTYQFYLSKSTDGGSSFLTRVILPFDVYGFNPATGLRGILKRELKVIPQLICNPSTGTLYLTWNNRKTVSGVDSAEVMLSKSTDQGSTWSTPINVVSNSSSIPSAGDQIYPWIATNSSGNRSTIMYYDFKDDPNSQEAHVYVAPLIDDGSGSLPSVRVTDFRSALNDAGFIGHYNGMATSNGVLHPIWADTRAELGTLGQLCIPDQYSAFIPENDIYYSGLDAIASSNKAATKSATTSNNARQLVKYSGKLHEVYTNGGEIYYRRFNMSSFVWEVTKRITNLATAVDYNSLPCIWKASDNSIHLVWQRKNGLDYDIYYSITSNSGDTWSSPIILPGCAGITVSSDQLNTYPVISELSTTTPKQLIVVFVRSGYTNGGLNYQKSTDNGNSWISSGPVKITNCGLSDNYNPRIWYPSIAAGSNYLTLNYGYRTSSPYLFSKIYNGTTWSTYSNVNAGIGTVQDRHSSVAVDGDGRPIASWCAGRSGQAEYRIIFRQGNTDNSWSSWFVEFPYTTGISDLYPSITHYNNGLTDPYAINIIYHRTNNQIILKDFSRFWNQWVTNSTINSAQWPSISTQHGALLPNFIMTNQSAIPYEVLWSGGIPKQNPPNRIEKHRMIVFQDAENYSVLSMELGSLSVITDEGKVVGLPFKAHDPTVPISLDVMNVWDYLGTEDITIPANAKWLLIKPAIESHTPEDSTEGGLVNTFTGVELNIRVNASSLSVNDTLVNKVAGSDSVQIDISKYAGKTVSIRVILSLPKDLESKIIVGVGDIFKESAGDPGQDLSHYQNAIATHHALVQNYPNPFNPSTTIKYELARGGIVRVSLFDVLGQELKVLVDEYKSTGTHEITFDGSTMQSGVYFCRLQAGDYHEVVKMVLMK